MTDRERLDWLERPDPWAAGDVNGNTPSIRRNREGGWCYWEGTYQNSSSIEAPSFRECVDAAVAYQASRAGRRRLAELRAYRKKEEST